MSAAVAIELRQVTKRFDSKVAVNGVSFQVMEGQCYGLIGPNGAGKTTTFSMMCGYLFPTHGELRVLGADPTIPGALKRKVGVLPQDALLPPWWTVGGLLTYWARLSGLERPEQEARAALERVGLPDSYAMVAGALSHGMAKRVSLAQALMGRPPIMLLDEPTAGLDPKMAASVRQLIRDMKGSQTVVVSSHNLSELEELCDSTAVLDRGNLVAAASMVEMTSQAAEFHVQIARRQDQDQTGAFADQPLLEVRALRGCKTASLDAQGNLTVQFDDASIAPEELITQTLELLIRRGVLIQGVSRGRKLEDRVLQLT